MLNEIKSKIVHKDKEGNRYRKKKTMSEVKPAKNMSKNLQFSGDKFHAKGNPSFT